MVVEERFPGELETLRSDNVRLRHLLKLSEEQARAADPDQAALSGAPESPVSMASAPEEKIRFFLDLFRCRPDVYALRWENRRDGRSGWMIEQAKGIIAERARIDVNHALTLLRAHARSTNRKLADLAHAIVEGADTTALLNTKRVR